MTGGAMRRIWAAVVKEILVITRDRRSKQMIVITPLIQLLIFASAATLEIKSAKMALLDQDGGAFAAELSSRLAASSLFEIVDAPPGPEALARAMDQGELLMAVTIPEGFSSRIADGLGGAVRVVYDGRRSNAAQVADGHLQRMAATYSAELSNMRGPSGGLGDASLEIYERHWYNPNLDHRWTVIPALAAILALAMTLIFSALSVAREREAGTFERLLATSLTPAEILLGKLIPCLMIGVLDSHLILACGSLAYGVPFRGSYPLALFSVALFSFSAVGFGLAISSIARDQRQAILGVFAFMIPSVLLSGFATPLENMPSWLERAVWINPTRHAIPLFKGIILKDWQAALGLDKAWPMAVIGAAALLMAWRVFAASAKSGE